MDIKQRLFIIPELSLASRLASMNDGQMDQYVKKLDEFVDCFPAKEKKLRASLEKKEIDSIINQVKEFGKILTDIYADDLADECAKHVNNFEKLSFDKINAYITYLLSSLITLSVDIQVAVITDEDRHRSDAAPVSTNAVKIILAVDDDPFCLHTLKTVLTDASRNVICATGGDTAINILANHKPDLFVLDIDMPGMNGIELAEKLRGLGYKTPIVFITGNADKSYVLKAINAGGADFIVKPINVQNVVGRVKKFI